MNEDDQVKKRRLIFIAVGILYIIAMIVIIFFSFSGDSKDESTYIKDEVTGREFFNDPNQAKEVGDSVDIVSLLQTEELVPYLYGDYLLDFRTQLTAFIHKNVSKDIAISYVDSSVSRNEEQEIIFDIITKDPVESRINATVLITTGDIVESKFKLVN